MHIRRRLLILCYAIVTFSAAPSLQATETTLPFVLHKGYTLVVRGSIGKLKGLNFIIDTGAAPSVVDTRLRHRLGLEGKPDQVSVFTKTIPAERVTLPLVEVGPIHAEGVEALTEDLSFIERGLGVRIDALIGLDVLGRRNFSIDYAAGCLRFDPAMDGNEVWAAMTQGDSIAVIEIELNGVAAQLMVDTGVNHLILFESRVRGLFVNNRIENVKVTSNIGGAARLKQIHPPLARLGHIPLAVESVFLLETPADLSLAIDGLLGVAALRPLRVDFDFERRAVGWKW